MMESSYKLIVKSKKDSAGLRIPKKHISRIKELKKINKHIVKGDRMEKVITGVVVASLDKFLFGDGKSN